MEPATGVDGQMMSSEEAPLQGREDVNRPVVDFARLLPEGEAGRRNAERLQQFHQSLIDGRSYTVAEIATRRDLDLSSATAWLEGAERARQVFTVVVEGEVVVPASLLDGDFEPIPEWRPVLETLAPLGRSGWSLWVWIDTPASLLDGEIPSDVVRDDPQQVLVAARRYVEQWAV